MDRRGVGLGRSISWAGIVVMEEVKVMMGGLEGWRW